MYKVVVLLGIMPILIETKVSLVSLCQRFGIYQYHHQGWYLFERIKRKRKTTGLFTNVVW